MSDYSVHRHAHGARLELDGLTVDADSPHVDRGVVRTVLRIQRDRAIVFNDTANLTSARARAKLLAALPPEAAAVTDAVLLALEAACRRPPPRVPPDAEKFVRDGGAHISDKVVDFPELTRVFDRWLLITDRALLPVFTGALLAHRLATEPVWLLLVAPPGATKTEPIRALYGYSGVYPLSSLTAQTFASGLDTGGDDPSLLTRLANETLVLKDFTTVLEMDRHERQAILAQLREIYDGAFDKAWGTGKEVHWQGRLGFVAGVTPVIDQHQAALAVMGERFITLRTIMPPRLALARRALAVAGQEQPMRAELREALQTFLSQRGCTPPAVSPAVRDALAIVADFTTRARSGVLRDGRSQLLYAPEPEAPTRFATVLLALASGIALAYDDTEVTPRALQGVLRVALDCLPAVRRRVIAALVKGAIEEHGEALSTTEIAGAVQFGRQTIRRALEDLQALEVVDCTKAGQGVADRWTLRDEWVSIFRQIGAAASVAEDGLTLEVLVGDVLVAEEPGPEARNGHAAIDSDDYNPDLEEAHRAAVGDAPW
jgi:hypothetical protein